MYRKMVQSKVETVPSETLGATFYGGLDRFEFYTDLKNSSPENFVYTRQIKEGYINALEFKRTQVILGDLYTAIVFAVAHAPYLIPIQDCKIFLRISNNMTGN